MKDNLFKIIAIATVAVLLILMTVLLISRCTPVEEPTAAPTEVPTTVAPTATPAPTPLPTGTPDPSALTIVSVGDILFQASQLEAARTEDGYDFTESFRYIRQTLATADLVIGNFEGVCAGAEVGFEDVLGYNVPDEALEALAEAGVDVLAVANEHIFDYGTDGALRTMAKISAAGMSCVGIRASESDNPWIMMEIKGIKVAVLAFSYSYGDDESIPESMYISYASDKLCAAIQAAKTAGAQVVAVQMHWGEEFSDTTLYAQKILAQDMLEAGADSIFGCHAHRVQELQRKSVTYKGSAKQIFVSYGMGNFLSPQSGEGRDRGLICGTVYTLNGKLSKTFYTPVWVQKSDITGKPVYRVLPAGLYAQSETRPALLSSTDFDAVKAVWNDCLSALGTAKADPEPGTGGVQ